MTGPEAPIDWDTVVFGEPYTDAEAARVLSELPEVTFEEHPMANVKPTAPGKIAPPSHVRGMVVEALARVFDTATGGPLDRWQVILRDNLGLYGEAGHYLVVTVTWNGAYVVSDDDTGFVEFGEAWQAFALRIEDNLAAGGAA